MALRSAPLLFLATLVLASPAKAETVYELVALCNAEKLGLCYSRIDVHLTRLNTGPMRRICLPTSFGAMLSNTIPVSMLERVRLGLSAARFGQAEVAADDVIVSIVNGVYPCTVTTKR
jgi:hypothetical protein